MGGLWMAADILLDIWGESVFVVWRWDAWCLGSRLFVLLSIYLIFSWPGEGIVGGK